jgi:hypothetical protein
MVMNLNTFNSTMRSLALVALLFTAFVNLAIAELNDPLFNFKFNHLSNIQNKAQDTQIVPEVNNPTVNFAQYDATWTYPWETKNMNIGLGLTLRHLSGFKSPKDENVANSYFQKTLPLVHASALFALPLDGLSAGVEGTRLDASNHRVFDYRAKVSYEWRKGFGMQGGWQHQQFNLNNATSTGADFEKNGPFIDLYLNF